MASNDLVPLKPKQKRRFYEPIIMYKALTDITHEEGALRRAEVPERPMNEEQKYHYFLNRLASICDSTKGGKTVTSITILDGEDKFTYAFGCNQVTTTDLHETRDFLTALLKKLSGTHRLGQEETRSVEKDVLKMILTFNSPRISCYLGELKKNIGRCLEYCERQTSANASSIGGALTTLDRDVEDITFKGLDEGQCQEAYKDIIQAIQSFLTEETKAYIEERAATQGRFNDGRSSECWPDLRHSLSRLQNYKRIVQDLIEAEKEWSEIFQEFVVVPIESSTKDPNPLGKKSDSAHAIIGRMCGDEASQEKYRRLAQNLQGMELDDRIKKRNTPAFRPIVHAEILVLEWVMAKSRQHPNSNGPSVAFFRDWKYIGSSKGACQLCRYYFNTPGQHDGIETRASHGNLYISWRFPDLYESDGSFGKTRRQTIFNSMIDKIRVDAQGILVSRNSEGKRHDSSTHPLSVRHTDIQTDLSAPSLSDIDELEQGFAKGLSLDSPDNSLEESDFDDENGGTSLR
ncbi:uncharacterized protein FTOL_02066 [Fusarium torulosum]|uniref:Uncharacterized protein n=1 Tax=Fusarium torulosum TaxID=33205 RepID=A0AAE8M1T9_9HYPO|nr:uncharacterized protein FTOL_02066 [Fusarium torulosum]